MDAADATIAEIFFEGEVVIPESMRTLDYVQGMQLFLGQEADAGKPVGFHPVSGIVQKIGFPTAMDLNGKVSKFMFVPEDPILIA